MVFRHTGRGCLKCSQMKHVPLGHFMVVVESHPDVSAGDNPTLLRVDHSPMFTCDSIALVSPAYLRQC